MNQLIPRFPNMPQRVIAAAADEAAELGFLDFFADALRNLYTRRSYARGWVDSSHRVKWAA